MQARFRLPVALIATLGLLTGCGGSSSSDQTAKFKKGFSSTANQFGATSRAIGRAIEHAGTQTDAQLAVTFHDLAGRWQRQVSRLRALKPPSSVAAAFSTMTGATTRAEADLTAVATAVQAHSASAARQATTTLVTDIASAKSAATTITNKLGIK